MNSDSSGMSKRISPSMVALLTGGIDKHYACALAKALAFSGITPDMVGNVETNSYEMDGAPDVKLLELYATLRPGQGFLRKLISYINVYFRLMAYAAGRSPKTFHILWEYKFPYFDRTLLLLYYKLLGKKIVFTAHNVNRAERDGVDSRWNRFTLHVQYRLVDHIFVHTKGMKDQLGSSFGISQSKVTVIPFGSGGMVPTSRLTPAEAKQQLGLGEGKRTVLFFGRIARYKGLDLLVDAFERVGAHDQSYRLIIAGEPMPEWAQHWDEVHDTVKSSPVREQVIEEIRRIADDEMEIYFKAADVLVLPYRQIFQSGVLFMSHSFGLPVIATDLDAFRDDIVEGTNGHLFRPDDPQDLAETIERYFSSELFRSLDERRAGIQDSLRASHSWESIARTTGDVYARISQSMQLKQRASSARITRAHLGDEPDAAKSLDS
jgi:D-inositol-3-phosphate glycosyltransferase